MHKNDNVCKSREKQIKPCTIIKNLANIFKALPKLCKSMHKVCKSMHKVCIKYSKVCKIRQHLQTCANKYKHRHMFAKVAKVSEVWNSCNKFEQVNKSTQNYTKVCHIMQEL